MTRRFGVYVHYPHCRNTCGYCEFPKVRGQAFPIEAYTDAVVAELRERAASFERWQLASIFFGGGTPSLWPAGQLGRVVEALFDLFGGDLAGEVEVEVEVTIEANPETVDVELIKQLQSVGVNRLSIGVQSLDDLSLTALTRNHSAETARQAVRDSVAAKLGSVAADLIFGYQGQGVEHHLGQLRALIALGPHHISTYALSLSENSKLWQRGFRPVEQDLAAEMMERGRRLLEDHGFVQYEVSNYAKQQYRCRHNSDVWRGQPYLGLGAWAHSLVAAADGTPPGSGGWFRQENPPLKQYLQAGKGRIEPLDCARAQQDVLMLGMRTAAGVDRELYEARFGQDLVNELASPIGDLERLGLVCVEERAVRPSRRGIWFADEIALRLMPA